MKVLIILLITSHTSLIDPKDPFKEPFEDTFKEPFKEPYAY